MILSEPLLLVGLAAGAWMWHVESNGRRRLLTLIIAVQILFMVLSGGDWPHMFGHGRFLYPVLPLCIWLLADAGALLWRRGHRSSLAMAAAALLVLSQLDLFGLSGVKLAPHFHLMRQGGRPPLTRQALARSYGRDLARKPAAVWWREATALFHTGRYRGSFDARAALWLQQKYGRETAIAAIQAGQFAYWSEMPFFDLFGLATPGVAPLRDDGRGMMAALGADNVRIVAFYRWGGDLHNRGVVGEGSLWRAGYGLRHVLQQGTRRAFVLFERGHKSELDPVKVLHTPLKDLPALVGPEVHVKIP